MSADDTQHHPQGEIIVVEDNTYDLKLMMNILKTAGYQVRPAMDGEIALRSVRTSLPDLILLDINLPDMSGVEVCRQLKIDPVTNNIPIIFISALDETDLKVKAFEGGGIDYITKPFQAPEVLARIKTHMDLHLLQRKSVAQSEDLIKEINERKRIEKKLEMHTEHLEELVKQRTDYLLESEEDLRESQRIAHVGSWRLDLVSNSVVWSEELYKMYGFDPALPPPPYTEHQKLFTPVSWDKLSTAMKNTIDTGIPYELELKTVRQDGSTGWMWVCGEALFDGKEVIGLRGAAQDITERKQAEEILHKNEETLRAMFNASPLAIVLIDKIGNIIDSNEEHANRLKIKRSQTLGKCIWDMLPENVRAHRKRQVESVFETGEPFTGEDKRGMVWSEYYIHPAIKNKNGEIEAVIVEALDITERKKAEEALKESKLFLENLTDVAYMADDKGNVAWVNSVIEKLTGFCAEELIGKSFLYLFIDEDHSSLMDVYKRTLRGESLENILTFTSGVSCHFTSIPRRNMTGEIIGTFGLARDITDKLRAEKALSVSEDRLRKAQAVAKIGNWEYDVPTGRVWGSEEAFRIYEIERTSEYLPLDEVESYIIEAKRVNQALVDLITKNEIYDIEFQIKSKNRQGLTTIHSIAELASDENGNPVKVLGVIQDITDSKVKEKERLELISQLQQAQKMESIGTLAGGIAHDFNNILFPILGRTEMLLEDVPEDSPFRNSLTEIFTSALRASELVKQILTFSRQENNELKLMKMQPIIKEALKLIRSTIPTTISINQNLQSNCGAIKADPTQIHQIIMNLATNAYHAMEDTGGELIVSLKQVELGKYDIITPDTTPGIYACLTMADTGVGMDKNLTDKIFDPFFTTKAIGKGTGMGLSVVHGIVHGMGGIIQVYSEPGKGTQFHVYFPVEQSSFQEQVTPSKAKIQGGIEQILLVDDEETILTMEKMMLERLGYQVTSHSSSLEALETFRANPDKFDLVITDMAVPNIPGDKLAAKLTKIRPDIPILLCTGFSETMSEEKAAFLGIKGFLMKPIVKKDLAQKIREVLDK